MAGRGRAFLFGGRKPTEPTEATEATAEEALRPRGQAAFSKQICEINSTNSEIRGEATEATAEEAPRPRGRAAFFKKIRESNSTNSEIRAGSSTDSETFVSAKSCESSKSKGLGRAQIFGNKSSSSGVHTEGISIQTTDIEQPPPVIKHGIAGTKLEVACNYVRLDLIDQNRGIWEYDVIFSPEVDAKIAKIKLVNRHFDAIGGKIKVFDGGSRLWTPMKMEKEFISDTYEFNKAKIEVTFKRKYLKKFSECHHILNIIMGKIKRDLQLVRFKRGDYNPFLSKEIQGHKLKVWPGIVTNVEEFEGGILLNCDASHRILQTTTVFDIMNEIIAMHARKGPGDRTSSSKDDIEKVLLGQSVLTNYSNRTVRIDDIDFCRTPKDTFEKNGKQISYIEYYKTQYNLDIVDTGQPLLVNRVKKKPQGKEDIEILNYYVPELCSITGFTDKQRASTAVQKEVAAITRKDPNEREKALGEFLRGIYENEKSKQLLEDWGLKLPTESIRLFARTLDPETIFFGGNGKVQEPRANWSRALSNSKLLSAVELAQWAIVFTAKDTHVARNFIGKSREIADKFGMKIADPLPRKIANDRSPAYVNKIREELQDCQIVVMIVPTKQDSRYDAIKKLCSVDLGLPSQVINSYTLSRDSRTLGSVVSKILLQMNCKIGGALWGVNIPHKEEGVMFCGIDIYHEARKRDSSIIALVSTINHNATQWTSATASHNPGQEISCFISNLFRDCLHEWHNMNGSYPKRIIMFRDGVGDGQLQVVKDFEIPQLKNMLKQVDRDDYSPVLTYMVVQKRINTRFYSVTMNRNTRSPFFNNPPPGTVVDHTITRRDWYDFFLVSQNVHQGTVSPTHYVVVEDSSGMTADQVQRITYKMTHLYYNWSGTVRVPAPCQYAHKLAYLVGEHLHAPVHKRLRNTLHFL